YVFAYNSTNTSQNATFGWNTAPGTVTVNAEGRTLAASGNNFTDTFGPSAAHVYVIGNGGGGGTPPPTPDNPTAAFTVPAPNATVSAVATVTVAASGGSGSGYSYGLKVDGTAVTGTGASFSWDTTKVVNGPHTLTANVADPMGGTGTATQTVTVSNVATPPPPPTGTLKVFVTQPTGGATVSNTVWAVMWLEGSTAASKTYTLTLGGKAMGSTTTASNG